MVGCLTTGRCQAPLGIPPFGGATFYPELADVPARAVAKREARKADLID
jgi:hypothetical protein